MFNWLRLAGKLLGLAVLCGCASTGVPNLYQVHPGVWRSGQPTTPEEWAYLKAIGIRTVIKLNMDDEGSDDGARKAGMTVYELGIQPAGDKNVIDQVAHAFVPPDATRVQAAVQILDRGNGVLVHCTHGQDRTGLVVGLYRVLHDVWSKRDAYEEMEQRGFHWELYGLREFWENFDGHVIKDVKH